MNCKTCRVEHVDAYCAHDHKADLEKRLAESETARRYWHQEAQRLDKRLAETEASAAAMREALDATSCGCDPEAYWSTGKPCRHYERKQKALSSNAGAEFEARIRADEREKVEEELRPLVTEHAVWNVAHRVGWNEAVEACAQVAEALSKELHSEPGSDGSEALGAFWAAERILKLKR